LTKETARRGDTAPGPGDSRATGRPGVAVDGNGRDTGELPVETGSLDSPSTKAANATAPLLSDPASAQTLVLGGLPASRTEITAELAHRAQQRNRRLLMLGLVLSLFLLVMVFLAMSPFTDPVAGLPPRTRRPTASSCCRWRGSRAWCWGRGGAASCSLRCRYWSGGCTSPAIPARRSTRRSSRRSRIR